MDDVKIKGFFKRPEGKLGAVILGVIGLGAAYGLYLILPALIAFATNLINLIILLAVLGLMIFLLTDKGIRNLVWFMYKSIMRTITGFFVEIDPIGIMKSYIEDLKKKLGIQDKQMGLLKGQQKALDNAIQENKATITKSLKLMQASKKHLDAGDESQRTVFLGHSRMVSRRQEANKELTSLLGKLDKLSAYIKKMYDANQFLITDLEDTVLIKERKRKAINAATSAFRTAMSVMRGDADKRAMFDMAIEADNEKIANQIGEMDRFMEVSQDIISNIDLQNDVFAEDGFKRLEEFEKVGLSFLDEPIATTDNDSFRGEGTFFKEETNSGSKYNKYL